MIYWKELPKLLLGVTKSINLPLTKKSSHFPLFRFIYSGAKKLETVKKLLKLRFLDYFSKGDGKECDQKHWNVSD